MKRRPFIIQGLCLGMILFGMHSSFYHIFLPYTSLPKFMVALFLASVWFTMLSVDPFQRIEQRMKKRTRLPLPKHPLTDLLLLLTLVVFAAYLLTHMDRLRQDAQIISDAFMHRYDLYYGNVRGGFRLSDYASNGSRLLFSVELVLTLIMAKAFSCRNGMFLGTLPVAIVISTGLLLGEAPMMWDMVCMVCGVLGMQTVTDGIRLGGRKGFRQRTTGGRQYRRGYPVAAVLLALVFAASSALSVATADTYMRGEEALLEMQHKMERKVVDASVRAIQKIMMMLGIDQPGVMNNVAPSFTGETVLTITADKKPENSLYLRGFIGTRYEDGRWSNPTSEKLQSMNRYLLMTQDYNAIQTIPITALIDEYKYVMSSDVSELEAAPTAEILHMKITYAKQNRSNFGYLPYYSRLADDSTKYFLLDGDFGIRRDPTIEEYMVDTIYMDSTAEDRLLASGELLRKGGQTPEYMGDKSQEADIKAYRDYVLEHDIWLPDEGLEKTKELAQKLRDDHEVQLLQDELAEIENDAASIIGQMRHFFWTSTSYSKNLRLKASRQDYVENFLFQQKKGFCEHYATAGAVLFRAMGVPARYVSGYKVSPQDFVENEDGTYTANVIDSKAHAWTEVYTYSCGWTIADMTPSDDRQDVAPSRDANDILNDTQDSDEDEFLSDDNDSSDEVSPQDDEDTTPTPEITDMPGDGEGAGETEKPEPAPGAVPPGLSGTAAGADSGLWKILKWAGMVCALCILLVLLWNLQAWLRYRRLKRCKSHRKYILEMNRLMERYLRCCGYRGVSNMTDREYIELLKTLCPADRGQDMPEQYYKLLEQARFAKDAGSREEIIWCKRMLYSVGRHVIGKCRPPRRFYVRWVRNWRR